MIPSGHVDTFARANLPPRGSWPEFVFGLPELRYPDRLNCVTKFVDRWVAAGKGKRPAIFSPAENLTYAQLDERINRIANVLTRDLGMVPGNRVLLRAFNSPMAIACYLAVIKAGGVMVATMPLLRAKEISYCANKAKIALALCDARLADEMEKTRPLAPDLKRIVYWGNGAPDALDALMGKPGYETFAACDTASDDVCFFVGATGPIVHQRRCANASLRARCSQAKGVVRRPFRVALDLNPRRHRTSSQDDASSLGSLRQALASSATVLRHGFQLR